MNDRNILEHDKDRARPEALMREFDFDLIDDDPLYAPGQGPLPLSPFPPPSSGRGYPRYPLPSISFFFYHRHPQPRKLTAPVQDSGGLA